MIGAPSVHLGGCVEWLGTLPGACADAVVTDPPYGIAAGAGFVRGGATEVVPDAGAVWNVEVCGWLEACARVVRPGGYAAFFYDMRREPALCEGFDRWSTFVWNKPAPPPCPRKAFMSAFELCCVAVRTGGPRGWWGGGATPNVWTGLSPTRSPNRTGHPCEKPVGLVRTLVDCLVPPGGLVVDPFTGSGTTGVACVETGRRFLGCEIDENYCALALRRIASATPSLFGVAAGGGA